MLRDLREFDDEAAIHTDLVIVGAGAAGITIARELANGAREVWLIESGGLEIDPESQALYDGDRGGSFIEPEFDRLRFFGGTTNHWGGRCRPLDAIDFERRDWVPNSGWPITRAEFDPYYARAQEVCQLGPPHYEAEQLPGLAGHLVSFDPDKFVNRLWQHAPPPRFGEEYGEALMAAPNVHVLLHANAVEFLVEEGAQAVAGLRLKTLTGRTATLRARTYVLACGGIENARLLLASNSVEKHGLGNRHDMVGRCFQEHPHALCAFAVPEVAVDRFKLYSEISPHEGGEFIAKPGLTAAAQRRHRILNGCLDIGHGYDRSKGYLAVLKLGKALRKRRVPDEFGKTVLAVLGDLGGVAGGLYRRLRDEDVLWFGANLEPAPNPESRITLGPARDPLGMPRVRIDWRMTELDKHSLRTTCRLLGEELARLGLARMRIDPWVLDAETRWPDVRGRYHHMCTTRMSEDPRAGVVDRNCRVHGIANLYIAGSSVFATGGYAHPTLSIVALSVRLADHLKEPSRG